MNSPSISRLRLPLHVRQVSSEGFAIEDDAGLSLGFVYFDDGCEVRRQARKRLTRAEAEAVARTMARALMERLTQHAEKAPPAEAEGA